jgi:hypothetical protein
MQVVPLSLSFPPPPYGTVAGEYSVTPVAHNYHHHLVIRRSHESVGPVRKFIAILLGTLAVLVVCLALYNFYEAWRCDNLERNEPWNSCY